MGYLDAHFIYPISSPKSVFSIESRVAADLGDYTKLAIRFIPLGETSRAMMITGASGRVMLDPPWYQASVGFIRLGVEHILTGIDHLLFLLCLVIPFRRVRGLIPVITAFTLGHSVTLIGTAYGLAPPGAWFPPFIETAIAVSIFYMALENIVGASLRHRWVIAGLFGLVHGFGFADILREQLQFAGSNLLVALFSFNVGIEIGQLAVLCVFVPAQALLFRGAMSGRMGIIVLSAIVAHIAWHWMIDRGQVLWDTPWPLPTLGGLMILARWIMALVLAVGAARLLTKWLDRKWPGQIITAEARIKT
jgi:HupE / UreJ protein